MAQLVIIKSYSEKYSYCADLRGIQCQLSGICPYLSPGFRTAKEIAKEKKQQKQK